MLGSKEIARRMHMHALEEHEFLRTSQTGVLIGASRGYSLPILFNPSSSMNPHALIVGATGSGKSFLLRALLLRLSCVTGFRAILVDSTGEYAQFCNENSIPVLHEATLASSSPHSCAICLDVHSTNTDTVRERLAKSLSSFYEEMLGFQMDCIIKTFVLIDEAWKLAEASDPLEKLVREGRKYGVGIVLASQDTGGLPMAVISNIATLFLFRCNSAALLSQISQMHSVPGEYMLEAKNFHTGSCLMIQSSNGDAKRFVQIKATFGVKAERFVRIIVTRDNMIVEVEAAELRSKLSSSCGAQCASAVASRIQNGNMELQLSDLIAIALDNGADRRRLLSFLRGLKIPDKNIADAFSRVIASGKGG